MAVLVWTFTFLVLLGVRTEAGIQTCTDEVKSRALQCFGSFFAHFENLQVPGDDAVLEQLFGRKMTCDDQAIMDDLLCLLEGISVCGNSLGLPPDVLAPLRMFTPDSLETLCATLAGMSYQDFSCLEGIGSNVTFTYCNYAANYRSTTECTKITSGAVCAMRVLRDKCPAAVADAYYDAIELVYLQKCPIAPCTLQYGDCGAKFQQSMPDDAQPKVPGDFPTMAVGIQYICGLGKSQVECMVSDDAKTCKGFESLMTVDSMFGNIQLEPAEYLLKYGCSEISKLTQKQQCMNQQVASTAFTNCFTEKTNTLALPEHPYDLISCSLYKATMECMDAHVANQCGDDAVDFFMQWAPATFRLEDGCGTWKVSAAMTTQSISASTIILSLAVFLFFKN